MKEGGQEGLCEGRQDYLKEGRREERSKKDEQFLV
jgi:hypothetical protein